MAEDFVAHASIVINAPRQRVWAALVTPAAIKQYMFGTNVVSDWQEGSRITWQGEWQGKPYEDKGVVLRFQPERLLEYSHFSPMTGLPDLPENYHTVTVELAEEGSRTRVSLAQDHNPTEDARAHSQANWEMMLGALKGYVEG